MDMSDHRSPFISPIFKYIKQLTSFNYVKEKLDSMNINYVHRFRRMVFATARYPCYSYESIDKMIHEFSLTKEEGNELNELADRIYPYHYFLIITSFIIFITYIVHGIYLLHMLDFNEPDNNLKIIDNNLIKFTCMITNCSRLSNNTNSSLGGDFLIIPHLSICKPTLRYFLLPFVDMGKNGYFMYALVGMGMCNYCCAPLIGQWIRPMGDDTLLFIIAPNCSKQIFIKRIRSIIIDIYSSLLNYRTNIIKRIINSKSLRIYEQDKLLKVSKEFDHQRELRLVMLAGYRYKDMEYDWSELDDFINDCMPIIRTEWWYEQIELSYKLCGLCAPIITIILTFGSFFNLYLMSFKAENELNKYGHHIRLSGCAIWLDNDNDNVDNRIYVDLENYSIKFSTFAVIQFAYLSAVPLISLYLALTGYSISIGELLSWATSLRAEVEFSVEYVRFKMIIDKFYNFKPRYLIKYKLQRIHEFFISRGKSIVPYLINRDFTPLKEPTKSRNLNRTIEYQRLAISWLNEDLYMAKRNSMVELMEKIYIRLRLLNSFKDDYAHSMTCTLIYNGISAYFWAIITLLSCRNINNFPLPFIFAAVCLIWNDSYILTAAYFKTYVSIIINY